MMIGWKVKLTWADLSGESWIPKSDGSYRKHIPLDEGYFLAEVWDNDPWSYSIVWRIKGQGGTLVTCEHDYSTASAAKSACTKALKRLRGGWDRALFD